MSAPQIVIVDDWLTYLQAFSTALAALVTATTIVFVAVQTRYTRMSVGATEASVAATQDAVKIAQNEFDRSTAQAADSAKARIDAEMPRLTTFVPLQAYQAWLVTQEELDKGARDPDAEDNDLRPGEAMFRMPRDADVLIQVAFHAEVSNDGPRRARLYCDQSYNHTQPRTETVVGVGDTETLWVRHVETLAQWIDKARVYLDGGDGRPATAAEAEVLTLTYVYPGDTGARERHRVIQGGSVIQPVPDQPDVWTIGSFEPGRYGGLNAVAQPFTREYWASISEDRRM